MEGPALLPDELKRELARRGEEDGFRANPDPSHGDKIYSRLSATGYITIVPAKGHAWNVQLTELGKKAAGERFEHLQTTDCDAWDVPVDMATVESVDVMGIVEDGVNAKVEAYIWFALTPVALAFKKQDPTFRVESEETGGSFDERKEFEFVKYDDGWRIK